MLKKDFKIALIVMLGIFLNCMLKYLVSLVSVPIWLDSIGTAIVAYILGPLCGAMVGVTSNIVYGIFDSPAFWYAIVNAAVGITIGLCAKKNMLKTVFNVVTAAIITTFVAASISTPISFITGDGYIGNEWGDGFINLLKSWGVTFVIASYIAEFFIDFTDKFITLGVLYLTVLCRQAIKAKLDAPKKKSKNKGKSLASIAVLFVAFCATISGKASAEENDYSTYIQTIYSNDSGLLSGEANDIEFTDDGVLWIGTYAGLYRYTGSEFKYMNEFESVKNVNCLYTDEEGRLWVGTNDDGLSICIDDKIVTTFNEKDGFPSNSVRSIVCQSTGDFFVGTSSSLVIVSLSGGAHSVRTFDGVQYAHDLTADDNGHVVAVTAAGELFVFEGENIFSSLKNENSNEMFSCCEFAGDKLYVGTDIGKIYVYSLTEEGLVLDSEIETSGLSYINCLEVIESGDIFICADQGIAWINSEGEVKYINSDDFNSSIDNITVDYQENLWFCSSRLGVMKLCESAFNEVYKENGIEETVVNAITEWQGLMYAGTDKGIDIIDLKNHTQVENEISEMLEGLRVRCLMVDSADNLWVCSYGEGIICVSPDFNITQYDVDNGAIGTKFRSVIELSDKTIAVSSDQGITFIKDGEVMKTLGQINGLKNPLVLCLLEANDGTLYAGTDGGGIVVIENFTVAQTLTRADGLGSGVILRLVKNKGTDGIFVVTSNGICYINDNGDISEFDNFPYSNNYDIYDDGEEFLYVTGSAGIHMIKKDELINHKRLNYMLLNYRTGLRGSFTANAWSYVDDAGSWYIPGDAGITKYNLNNEEIYRKNSYRMIISSVKIDGQEHVIDDGRVINIPQGVSHIQLTPEIINYSSREPYVCYYLEGVDDEKYYALQGELGAIDYTNLKAGEYRFHLAILDSDHETVIEEQIFTIVKEAEIQEHYWFVIYFFFELVCIVAWFTWFITRKISLSKLEVQQKEIALVREQIRMGNETILAIARTVDAKDSNTSLHSTRVSEYSVLIADKLGYSDEEKDNLRKAALLHDIGKIGIPDSVLNKPGRLNDEEYEIMKSHVLRGAEILKDFSLVPNVKNGALYHHERYDGKGYASGLKGKEIPEMARIIGIADAFDAMTANRVYRKKLDFDFVLGEIKKGRGTQFDPDITDIFLEIIDEGLIDVDSLYKEEGEQ